MTAAPSPRTVDGALALVRRCDPLPFPSRSRALALAARALAPGVFDGLHARLDDGGPDDRRTALFLAVARRDLDRVAAALADPLLQPRALAAAVRLPVPDAALRRLVLTAPPAVRRRVYGVLRRSRRRRLADGLLDAVAAFGDADVAALLPACSPGPVSRWLPRIAVPDGALRSLARTAPLPVARLLVGPSGPRAGHAELVTVLARRSAAAALLLVEHRPALLGPRASAVVLGHPEELLAIVRRTRPTRVALPSRPLPPATTAALRRCAPAELVELCAAFAVPEQEEGVHRRRRRRRLADPALLRAGDGTDPLVALLPPDERVRVAGDVLAGGRGYPGRGGLARFAALAPADRLRLVERLGIDLEQLWYLRPLLPLPAVRDALVEQVTAHRHTVRMTGWPALLECAQRHGDPRAYAEVVDLAVRAWHDRDAVRSVALAQAAVAPAGLLDAVGLPALREATAAVVQFGDTSAGTAAALTRWLHRTIQRAVDRGEPERAADVVVLLCAARHRAPRPLRIDATAAAALWALLADRVHRSAELVVVGRLLRDALPAPLDERLAAIWRDPQDPAAPAAARVWAGGPALRDGRSVAAVASLPALPDELVALVATRRTDRVDALLDRLAADRAEVSRILRAVPPGAPGRWPAGLRARWERLLADAAADPDLPFPARAAAAARVTRAELLLGLCRSDAQPVTAAALAGVGAHAGPEAAVGELVGALPLVGARGRAALAGLRRLADRLPGPRALDLLRDVLLDPAAGMGARKAAARVIADVGPPAAARDALHAAWDRPDLPRDVRIAVAERLLRFLAEPATASRLAAHLSDPAVRSAVLRTRPGRLRPPAVVAALDGLVLRALRHPEAAVREAALHAGGTWSRRDGALLRVAELVVDPELPWHTAQHAVRLIAADGTARGAEAFRAAVAAARALPAGPRQARLGALAAAGDQLPAAGQDELAGALAAARMPAAAAGCARAAALHELERGRADVRRWLRYVELVGDRPQRTSRAHRWAWRTDVVDAPADEVAALLGQLEGAGGLAARLAVLDVLAHVGQRSGWAPRWRAELAARRGSDDPDVAEAAWRIGPDDRG